MKKISLHFKLLLITLAVIIIIVCVFVILSMFKIMSTDVRIFVNSVYNFVMYMIPGFLWLLFTLTICWLSYLFGVKHSDSIWKNNIKYHMPKVTKDEIETRDKKINQLSYKYRTLKTEYDKMVNVVNAMKGIAGVMDEGKK